MNQTRFIKLPEVRGLTALSRSEIYRLIGRKQFPVEIKTGERASAWNLVEVEQWKQSCFAIGKTKDAE